MAVLRYLPGPLPDVGVMLPREDRPQRRVRIVRPVVRRIPEQLGDRALSADASRPRAPIDRTVGTSRKRADNAGPLVQCGLSRQSLRISRVSQPEDDWRVRRFGRHRNGHLSTDDGERHKDRYVEQDAANEGSHSDELPVAGARRRATNGISRPGSASSWVWRVHGFGEYGRKAAHALTMVFPIVVS